MIAKSLLAQRMGIGKMQTANLDNPCLDSLIWDDGCFISGCDESGWEYTSSQLRELTESKTGDCFRENEESSQ